MSLSNSSFPEFTYRGARALVILHEQEMQRFLTAWECARVMAPDMPDSMDPDLAGYDALLAHVLSASRGYILWICEVLDLEDPGIDPVPDPPFSGKTAEDYLVQLLEKWRTPLTGLTEEQCYSPEYTSRWNVKFCIDAMLEHAVMHPVRHRFQLEEFIATR